MASKSLSSSSSEEVEEDVDEDEELLDLEGASGSCRDRARTGSLPGRPGPGAVRHLHADTAPAAATLETQLGGSEASPACSRRDGKSPCEIPRDAVRSRMNGTKNGRFVKPEQRNEAKSVCGQGPGATALKGATRPAAGSPAEGKGSAELTSQTKSRVDVPVI